MTDQDMAILQGENSLNTSNTQIEVLLPSIRHYLLSLQNEICKVAEQEDGLATFKEEKWDHATGGGGITRVLQNGAVFEKAGVNFSHVKGHNLPSAALVNRPQLQNASFQALGVSVVMHPLNPYVPTSHFNVRFIVAEVKDQPVHWWFGGGFDLTPYYPFAEDCKHFHLMAKNACDPFGEAVYPRFKAWADQYFFIKHRNEPRGIGGIFFDDLNEWDLKRCFTFMQAVGSAYVQAYQPIVAKRKATSYGERERQFQLVRRGRYVEFNLLYDRGTLFGLQSNGRTESILMSLPPLVAWDYEAHLKLSINEAVLYRDFLKPRDWVV